MPGNDPVGRIRLFADDFQAGKGNGNAMIEGDSIKLLRECDAGVKMGVASMEDMIGYIHDDMLRQSLAEYPAGG